MILNAVFVVITLLFVCCSSSHQIESQKFDAPLKQKLSTIQDSNSDEVIKIFAKCSQNISEDMQSSLEAAGVTVESVVGDIFTGSGTAKQIEQLSTIDFVTQINLSTKSKPLY